MILLDEEENSRKLLFFVIWIWNSILKFLHRILWVLCLSCVCGETNLQCPCRCSSSSNRPNRISQQQIVDFLIMPCKSNIWKKLILDEHWNNQIPPVWKSLDQHKLPLLGFFWFSSWLFVLGETRQRLIGHFNSSQRLLQEERGLACTSRCDGCSAWSWAELSCFKAEDNQPSGLWTEWKYCTTPCDQECLVCFFFKHVYAQKEVKSQGRFYSREARQEAAFTVGRSEYAQGWRMLVAWWESHQKHSVSGSCVTVLLPLLSSFTFFLFLFFSRPLGGSCASSPGSKACLFVWFHVKHFLFLLSFIFHWSHFAANAIIPSKDTLKQ